MIGSRFLPYPLLAAALLVSACAGQRQAASREQAGIPSQAQHGSLPSAVTAQEESTFYDPPDRIFFDFDSAALSAWSIDAIARQAEWLKAHPDVNIRIEGHTAASEGRAYPHGPEKYNLDLGCRRAKAMRDALIEHGVAAERLGNIVSYGEHRPAVLGDIEAAWAQNRRAVFVVWRGPAAKRPESNCGEQ